MTKTLPQIFIRPLIALSLAAGIALTPVSAAPAKAGNDELAAFIAALTAMVVIGAVIEDGRDRDRGRDRTVRRWDRDKVLPESCLKSYRARDGVKAYFSKRCLKRSFRHFQRLPDRCEKTVRVRTRDRDRGWERDGQTRRFKRVNVYKPRCLRRAGYHIPRNDFRVGRTQRGLVWDGH